MSSMDKRILLAAPLRFLAATTALAAPAAVFAQYSAEWDRDRGSLVAQQPGQVAREIARWQSLWGDTQAQLPFTQYASFLIANPGYPDEVTLRSRAERRLREEFVDGQLLLDFFRDHPPVTNYAKAHYALALMGSDPAAAERWAREAWRGGEMSPTAEAALSANFGSNFSQEDQDRRMDALLWQRDANAAARQLMRASPSRVGVFQTRLNILQSGDGYTSDPSARTDPGYLYNRSRELR